jgi:hypothetical protein
MPRNYTQKQKLKTMLLESKVQFNTKQEDLVSELLLFNSESSNYLSEEILADFFIEHFYLIKDFSTLDGTKTTGREIRILAYKKDSSNIVVNDALIILRKKLRDNFFPVRSIQLKFLHHAVINALVLKSYKESPEEEKCFSEDILNYCNGLKNRFTLTVLKRNVDCSKFNSKELEKLLLENGYSFKTYKGSLTKYFSKN